MFSSSSNLLNSLKSTLSSAYNRLEAANRMASSSSATSGKHNSIALKGSYDQQQANFHSVPVNRSAHVHAWPRRPGLVVANAVGAHVAIAYQMHMSHSHERSNTSEAQLCQPIGIRPIQPVTLNMGMRMNSWFDLKSLNPNDPEDEEGIEAASRRIHELIDEQQKKLGIPHDRIFLGGFSQGGALALYAAFTYPKKLAGVVALSCWLPLHKKVPSLISEANKTLPVFQCHGDADFVVPIQWGTMSSLVMSQFLDKTNYIFKVYHNLGHSSSVAELDDVLRFINHKIKK